MEKKCYGTHKQEQIRYLKSKSLIEQRLISQRDQNIWRLIYFYTGEINYVSYLLNLGN